LSRCAPEALTERKFDEKSDVWSFGVTMWEIFSYGETPKLGEIGELVVKLHEGKRLQRPAACPLDVYNIFFYACWEYKKEARRRFAEIRDLLKAEMDKHSTHA